MQLRYIAARIIQLVPVLFIISLLAFGLVVMIPGDAADVLAAGGGGYYSPHAIALMRDNFGLDQPVHIRYVRWASSVVRGDLGRSLRNNERVANAIRTRLPVSAYLALGAMIIAVVAGVLFGLISATFQGTWLDRTLTLLASTGVVLPNFVLGILLLVVFAQYLRVLPAFGYQPPSAGVGAFVASMLLPWITAGSNLLAEVTRQMRSSTLDVMSQDYVRTARAKGLRERAILFKHTTRNALFPVITIAALSIGRLLGGAVITETVFNLPGLGTLAVSAFSERDFTVIQGVILVAGAATVLASLIADLAYVQLDPRLREA